MQQPSSDGLISAPDDSTRRWTTVPIYNASEHEAAGLERLWRHKSAGQAHAVLSKPDVTVTNATDKLIQLGKLEQLNQRVMAQMAKSKE